MPRCFWGSILIYNLKIQKYFYQIIFIQIWSFKRHRHNYAQGDAQAEIQQSCQGRRDTREEEPLKKRKIGTQVRAGGKAATPEQTVRRLRREHDCKGAAADGGTHIIATEQNLHWTPTPTLPPTKATGYYKGHQQLRRKSAFQIFVYLILIYFSELETEFANGQLIKLIEILFLKYFFFFRTGLLLK